MARTSQHVQIGRRKIELSNLEKVLYPEDGIIKAEIIEYYLKLAPTILTHTRRRPLSMIRFPDGITGESFFQKNRPTWAPDWVEYVALGDERKKINYILATEEATLVWLANLACLELHQVHAHKPHYRKPDYFVFDLDPPEGYRFADVVAMALDLKGHIESYGYQTFAKTTGRKGIHIVAPIEPVWDLDTVFEAIQDIAKAFVSARRGTTTLTVRKDKRVDKVLIDIYRNRGSQTIVSPYSLRGSPKAPVSMPLPWEELETVTDPLAFHIRNVPERVMSQGDAWESMAAYAVDLHTKRRKKAPSAAPEGRKELAEKSLERYDAKRSFDKTPEPPGRAAAGRGNAFVIHRHHASRLHYDVRLEQGGVLKSYAVPKGLPPRPGVMRLAVHTEDHPLEYLDFHGTIPKGQYGAGRMWIFSRGKYEVPKRKKGSFYFTLHGKNVSGEYRMHETKDNQWLLERVDSPQVDYLRDIVDPMLGGIADTPPAGDYVYEVKWDGIRAMIVVEDGIVRIRSRNRRDITEQFPELCQPERSFRCATALFDGEIVCLDEDGRPVFKDVINRLRQRSERAVKRAQRQHPAVCYLFDCLYLDGRPIVNDPLFLRREWLLDSIRVDAENPYRMSEAVDDGESLFEAASGMGLEGIMAKERQSVYRPGRRTTSWVKVKARTTIECVVIGYTRGKGDRSATFGALQLARPEDDNLRYLGKVGTGFTDRARREVLKELKKVKTVERPIQEKPLDDSATTWLQPEVVAEVQYASLTNLGTLREPVFLRLRPDLSPEDLTGGPAV